MIGGILGVVVRVENLVEVKELAIVGVGPRRGDEARGEEMNTRCHCPGKLVEANFLFEFLKEYPKVDWGLHYGFGMSSVAVVL
ncbi:hypothetical protein Droror1_Dr00025432 [Drosera rotundifolia]